MSYLQALVLAVIEGVTEFLPVSSTGHMIIGSSAMGIAEQEFTKLFTVCIQFGAILSVVVLYWRRFCQSFSFYLKLFVGFLPAAILGKLLGKEINALLENVVVVAASLLVGGVILLFVDHWFRKTEKDGKIVVSYPAALKIGIFQTIAMVPGVSRSAATIIGGLAQKLTRQAAAEFSFFLAVPTMLAATLYKLYQFHQYGYHLDTNKLQILLIGNLVAFITAMLAIRSFIGYLQKHGFRLFGYYRIALGLTILILYFSGFKLQLV
ncbi:MAG: undecaprenyl-diphosphate phosphatase [Deltaproteobacteria bacterium]|nr:undecaprenyl-diphosphate phosphatase [Deltaproteobacteria bacterium]